ncbi:MAG: hypothetical protein HOQ05_04860 [Corynebacteriales bacterium]|nr:hypothetical protein [Mycobacteriales bacterium]
MTTSPLHVEADKLAQALVGWAKGAVGSAQGHTCAACPLCRLLAQVKIDDPELADRVADAITDTTAGLVKLLGILTTPRGSAATNASTDDKQYGSSDEGSVQHINIETE